LKITKLMQAVLVFVLKIFVLLLLPFLVLIHGAVYMHVNYASNPQIAILTGALATVVLLMLYFSYLYFRTTGRLGNSSSFKLKMLISGLLVLVYCFNGLFFFKWCSCKDGSCSKGVYQPAHDPEAEYQHDSFC